MVNKVFIRIFPILIALILGVCGCHKGRKKADEPSSNAQFQFESDFYDFGVVQSGDTVMHAFNFTNTGSDPLLIYDISATCGCTVVEWSKQPIKPGNSGFVNVQFSKGHDPGLHKKDIIIKANTKDPYTVLKILAEIPDSL